jgi:hypothetical protein
MPLCQQPCLFTSAFLLLPSCVKSGNEAKSQAVSKRRLFHLTADHFEDFYFPLLEQVAKTI